jgi:hypothetical protein
MALIKIYESDVMRMVDQALSAYYLPHHRNNVGAAKMGRRWVRYGWPGSSDYIGICPGSGRFLAVECKRPDGGRLSADQREWLDMINRNGGVGIVADGLDSLIRQLKGAGVI